MPDEIAHDTPETFEAAFRQLFDDCLGVMVDRQIKYGRHNIPRYGLHGTLVRMGDKFARLENLIQNGSGADSADESIEDTLIDICNYSQIMRAQLRGWWTNESCPPLAKDPRVSSIDSTGGSVPLRAGAAAW